MSLGSGDYRGKNVRSGLSDRPVTLVVGREGQLARSLNELKRPDGVEIFTVGRPELDLAAPETIGSAIDRYSPRVVVNCAAYTAVDRAELEPTLAYAINAAGAAHVARACAQRAAALIHLSTDYVFDGSKPAPYSEEDPVAPLGVYGRTKLQGEQLVAAQLSGRTASVHPITTAEYPTPARRPQNSRLNCSKIAHTFGVRLPDWRVGVAECVRSLGQDDRFVGSTP